MDPAVILADAQALASLANIAIQLGADVAPYVTRLYNLLVNNQALTDQERNDLVASQQQLSAQLQSTD